MKSEYLEIKGVSAVKIIDYSLNAWWFKIKSSLQSLLPISWLFPQLTWHLRQSWFSAVVNAMAGGTLYRGGITAIGLYVSWAYFFLCLVSLMTLSGPDAEALFQSLIRDDPSAVGVVDTTTPPPSIQPTSSLESTTQEQRF